MALDFVKNASNYLSYSASAFNSRLSGASKIAISAWVFIDALDAVTFGNVILQLDIDGVNAGFKLSIDGSSGQSKVRVQARSQAADTAQTKTGTVDVGTGSWVHVGGLVDFGGDTITTVSNGNIESTTAFTFGASTYTPGTPTTSARIGAGDLLPIETNQQFDGRIAELVIWPLGSGDAALTAGEWAALGKFWSPAFIRSGQRVFHERFVHRRASPTDDVGGLVGTITGSLSYATHPPMIQPSSGHIFVPRDSLRSMQGNFTAQEADFDAALAVTVSAVGLSQAQFATTDPSTLAFPSLGEANLFADDAGMTGGFTGTVSAEGSIQAGAADFGGTFTGDVTLPENLARFRRWWIGIKLRQGGGEDAVQQPFLEDTFTEASDTLLAAHTSDSGEGWTEHPNFSQNLTVIASEDRAAGTSVAASGLYFNNKVPDQAEYDIEAVLRWTEVTGTACQVGLLARMSPTVSTFYYAFFNGATIQILRFVSGSATVMDSMAFVPTPNTDYAVKFEIRDGNKKVIINEVEYVSTTDNTVTDAGRIGLSIRSQCRVDNLSARYPS